jgi:hypothetical protein
LYDHDCSSYGVNISSKGFFIMTYPSSDRKNESNNGDAGTASDRATSGEYKVGYGCPPKDHQYKKGQSGNPKGRKPKPSIQLDLKLALEQALNQKIRLRQGEKERLVTMATAGIEQLVAQYAKGDPRARQQLIAIADKLGVDLIAGQHKVLQKEVSGLTLSEDVLDRLPGPTLDEIIRVVEQVEAEKKKKLH